MPPAGKVPARPGSTPVARPAAPATPPRRPAAPPRPAEVEVAGGASEPREESRSGRAGASGRQPRVGAERPSRDEIAGLRPTGMSLGLKFALLISITITAACSLLFLFAYGSATAAVDKETNDAGCRVVRCMAAVGTEYWREAREHSMSKRGSEKMLAFQADLQGFVTLVGGMIDNDHVPAFNTAKNDFNAKLAEKEQELRKALRAFGQHASLNSLQESSIEIVELFVVDANSQYLIGIHDIKAPVDENPIIGADSQPPESKHISLKGSQPLGATKDGVNMFEGSVELEGVNIPARQYDMKFGDDTAPEKAGGVVLLLSVKSIEETQSALLMKMLIPLVIAVVAGILVALYLSKGVTDPVKTLVQDFNTVAQGDLSHHTVAHSADEIGVLARSFNVMTKSLKAAQDIAMEQKAVEHELKIAVEIQTNLLPKKLPKIPRWDINAFYRPSKEVGGDYYDFIQIDQDHLGVVVADVSGKGIPGSMVMGMARALIRMEAERNFSTSDTLIKVNRILARDIKRGMFVTCMYMVLDLKTYQLKITSAGHDPLILVRQATRKHELINPNGIALGFDKGPIFERTVKEQVLQIYPGDRFTSYTDGVPESMNPDSEEFGLERFYKMNVDLAQKTSGEFIDEVVAALDEHQGNGEQHDDITLVTLRLMPS
ncbi:MAG: SpoIIE family protein phosphatase [Planctomycetes bacterium]|nr:SpoIIE family protein phosphatase [Planctomycetota bacterium]